MTDATQADALRGLLQQVEEGCGTGVQIIAKWMASEARDVGKTFPAHSVEKAFGGSLDAAKALHEVLLPGWEWVLTSEGEWGGEAEGPLAMVAESAERQRDDCKATADTPARAWLLAILRARLSELSAQPPKGDPA